MCFLSIMMIITATVLYLIRMYWDAIDYDSLYTCISEISTEQCLRCHTESEKVVTPFFIHDFHKIDIKSDSLSLTTHAALGPQINPIAEHRPRIQRPPPLKKRRPPPPRPSFSSYRNAPRQSETAVIYRNTQVTRIIYGLFSTLSIDVVNRRLDVFLNRINIFRTHFTSNFS